MAENFMGTARRRYARNAQISGHIPVTEVHRKRQGRRWVEDPIRFCPAGDYRRLMPMFSAAKDMMTSSAAKAYVNNVISAYGKVDELNIDSKRSRIEVLCRLNGEVAPIGVTIEKYKVEQDGAKKYILVLDSSATRPWMEAVMRDHLHGRRLELPSWAATAL
jgi:hypothetical protein